MTLLLSTGIFWGPQKISPQVQAKQDDGEEVTGELSAVTSDDFENQKSETKYYLTTNDRKRHEVEFSPGQAPELRSATKVKLHGKWKSKRQSNLPDSLFGISKAQAEVADTDILQVQSIDSSEPIINTTDWAIGSYPIAVVVVGFTDVPWTGSIDDVRNKTLTNLPAFYQENSYHKLSVSGQLYGPYQLAMPFTCDNFAVQNMAISASDTDINFSQIKGVVYALAHPAVTGCNYSGISTLGPRSLTTNDGTVSISQSWGFYYGTNLDKQVFNHEFGHGLGAGHSWKIDCSNEEVNAVLLPGSNSACTNEEYGDVYDVMGFGQPSPHFNAYQKEKLGWFESSQVLQVSQSGQYAINRYENSDTSLKAIKIRRNRNSWYYFEYRGLIGFDSNLSSEAVNGLLMHINSSLLDADPSDQVWAPSSLKQGQAFNDPGGGFSISVSSLSSNSATVNIQVINNPDVGIPFTDNFQPDIRGQTVSGILNFSLEAEDDRGVYEVIFWVDGARFLSVNQPPYRLTYNASNLPNGSNLGVVPIAYDRAGNYSPSYFSWDLKINTVLPSDTTAANVTLTDPSPHDGETVSGTIQVDALVTGNDSLTLVEFMLVGVESGWFYRFSRLMLQQPPYGMSYNTTQLPDGIYRLYADAYETSSQISQLSSWRTIYINNHGLTLSKTVSPTGSVSPGTPLDYTIRYQVGSAAVTNINISDPIPANSTYVPGSATINGVSKTDASDGDGFDFFINHAFFHFDSLAANANGQVTFQVTVNSP